MRVEPFLIASSVLAVLAQRLVRRVCTTCGGQGCPSCRGTGYRGRTAIHELLPFDDAVRALVMARADAATIRRHATAGGMATLRDDGLAKVAAGVTTRAEVLRATEDDA
jgi:general secretion pathway protein E